MRLAHLFSLFFVFVLSINLVFSCLPGPDAFNIRTVFYANKQTQECIKYSDSSDISVERPREIEYSDSSDIMGLLDRNHAAYALPEGWFVTDEQSCSQYKRVELEQKVVLMPQNLPIAISKILSINFTLLLIPLSLVIFFIILRLKKSDKKTTISSLMIVFGISTLVSFWLYDFVWNKLFYCRFTSLYSWSELRLLMNFPIISLLFFVALASLVLGLVLLFSNNEGKAKPEKK